VLPSAWLPLSSLPLFTAECPAPPITEIHTWYYHFAFATCGMEENLCDSSVFAQGCGGWVERLLKATIMYELAVQEKVMRSEAKRRAELCLCRSLMH